MKKLRNKKTGEINCGDLHLDDFDSLAELNEEWEDYEEPKVNYWCIDWDGSLKNIIVLYDGNEEDKKEIGNYFETREDAEKAVEKLKAWKRLKDNGISFSLDVTEEKHTLLIKVHSKRERATFTKISMIAHDLMLIFGSEE